MSGVDERAGRHLLVVDDDDRIRGLIKEYLTRAGFRVTAAPDAAAAERLMATLDFDLIVLDVMMPGEDGFSFTRRLREGRAAIPILLLTARGLPGDRIEGLKTGADDYLGKPFEPEELLLRIEAILRRAGPPEPLVAQVKLGDHAFDLERGELRRGAALVRLTEAETELLRRLARAQGEPVERHELGADGDGRAVDVQVTRLRRKIEPDPKAPRFLLTARGIGYRLAPDA